MQTVHNTAYCEETFVVIWYLYSVASSYRCQGKLLVMSLTPIAGGHRIQVPNDNESLFTVCRVVYSLHSALHGCSCTQLHLPSRWCNERWQRTSATIPSQLHSVKLSCLKLRAPVEAVYSLRDALWHACSWLHISKWWCPKQGCLIIVTTFWWRAQQGAR
jgi:hypothetical protein